MSAWPGINEAMEFAQMSLLNAPGEHLKSLTKNRRTRDNVDQKVQHITRVEALPIIVFRAVLPLELCLRMNELLGPKGSLIKVSKGKSVFKNLHQQNGCDRTRRSGPHCSPAPPTPR